MTQFSDKELTCVECNAAFTFSAGEQERFQELGFTNEPKRCGPCRAAKKAKQGGGSGGGQSRGGYGGGGGGAREMTSVVCSECGKPAQVPFKPRGDKPVYCSACFSTRR
jgi:CxxC-x17-CxxC domain-containing protein